MSARAFCRAGECDRELFTDAGVQNFNAACLQAGNFVPAMRRVEVLVADMHRVVEPLACTPDQLDGRHYGPKGMAKQLALLLALMQRSRLDAEATRAEKSGWAYY